MTTSSNMPRAARLTSTTFQRFSSKLAGEGTAMARDLERQMVHVASRSIGLAYLIGQPAGNLVPGDVSERIAVQQQQRRSVAAMPENGSAPRSSQSRSS